MMPGGDERWNEETTGLSAGALENILARVTNDFTPQHQHQNYQPGFVPSAAPGPPWPAAPQAPNPNMAGPTPVGHNISVSHATVGAPVSSHSGLGSPVPNTLGIATQVPIQTTNTSTSMGSSAARSYSVSQDYFSDLGGSRNPLLRSSSDLGIRLNQFQNQGGNYQDGRMEGFMDSSDSLEDFSQTPAYGQESVFFPEVQCGGNVNSGTPPPMQAESTGIQNSVGPGPQMQFSFYSNERDKITANFTAKLSNFTASLGSWFSPFDSFRSNNLASAGASEGGQQGASLVPPGCEPTIILEEPLQASHNASPSTIGTGRSTPNCNLNSNTAANYRDTKPTYSSVLSKNTASQDCKLSSNGANSSSRSSSSSSNSACITHPPQSSSPGLNGTRSEVPQTRSAANHNSNNSNKGKNRNSNSTSSNTSNGSTHGSSAVNTSNGNTSNGNTSNGNTGTSSRGCSYKTTDNHINSSRVGLDDFDLTNLTNGRISAYEHYAWEGADLIPNGSIGGPGNKGAANSPAHQAKKNNSKSETKKNTPEKTNLTKNQETESSRSTTDQLNNKVASGQQKQQPRRTSYINNNLNASNSNASFNNNIESNRTESSKIKPTKEDKKFSDESSTSNNNGNTGNSSNSNSSHIKSRSGKGANSTGGRSERSERNLRENSGKTRPASRRKKDASLTHTELVVAGWAVVVQWAGIVGQFATYLFHLALEVIVMSGRLFFQFLTILGIWAQERSTQVKSFAQHYWYKFSGYFRKGSKEENKAPGNKGGKERRASYGLECNIALPTTGEEAMKRLLACKGKDPYSILGVTHGCTDEDVKKYYKRQAFLVHPDKNKQPGAEEAFKILAHAFEIIGEPERRAEYDTRLAEEVQLEASWSELASLLTRLQEKLDEAANTIRCTNCNKRHRRTKLSRPMYAARHCAECQINHAAREGDIWAESTMFGLRWRYYACMEGAVYDISEWAACQNENLKHLQSNTHSVQYRIVSGKKNPANKNNTPDFPSDPDLEEFFNNLCKEKFGKNYSGGSGGGQATNGGQGSEYRKRKGKKKK